MPRKSQNTEPDPSDTPTRQQEASLKHYHLTFTLDIAKATCELDPLQSLSAVATGVKNACNDLLRTVGPNIRRWKFGKLECDIDCPFGFDPTVHDVVKKKLDIITKYLNMSLQTASVDEVSDRFQVHIKVYLHTSVDEPVGQEQDTFVVHLIFNQQTGKVNQDRSYEIAPEKTADSRNYLDPLARQIEDWWQKTDLHFIRQANLVIECSINNPSDSSATATIHGLANDIATVVTNLHQNESDVEQFGTAIVCYEPLDKSSHLRHPLETDSNSYLTTDTPFLSRGSSGSSALSGGDLGSHSAGEVESMPNSLRIVGRFANVRRKLTLLGIYSRASDHSDKGVWSACGALVGLVIAHDTARITSASGFMWGVLSFLSIAVSRDLVAAFARKGIKTAMTLDALIKILARFAKISNVDFFFASIAAGLIVMSLSFLEDLTTRQFSFWIPTVSTFVITLAVSKIWFLLGAGFRRSMDRVRTLNRDGYLTDEELENERKMLIRAFTEGHRGKYLEETPSDVGSQHNA